MATYEVWLIPFMNHDHHGTKSVRPLSLHSLFGW